MITPHDKHRRIVDLKVQIESAQKTIEQAQQALLQIEATPTSTPCNLCEHLEKESFCTAWSTQVPNDYLNQDNCTKFIDAIPF